jgi:NAD(P)-dependent dehydrogenase (short-subunit alcohol dehydrogenase family)
VAKWTMADAPTQTGRSAVVTGSGGLGLETALALASAGADVIIAARNPEKGEQALARILRTAPGARVRFELLDLASLASIARFGERLRNEQDRLDILVNNAGVMVPPRRGETVDGFELQFGTNHLGHFALTGQLLPLLRDTEGARIVSLSSVAARAATADFEDWNALQSYRPMQAYGRSKLACLMFARELDRRSKAAGWKVSSIAAHPGVSRTDLLHNGPGRGSIQSRIRSMLPFLFQPAAQGALPTLFAATSSEAHGGGYYGPDKLSETRGYPTEAKIPDQALDAAASARLWMLSEQLTGVTI